MWHLYSLNVRETVWVIISVCVLFFYSTPGVAQTSTLVGGSSLAQECFQNSQTAVMTDSASRLDLEPCNRALLEVGLRKHDRVATLVNRGIIHVAMESYADAARDYNRAIELNENVGEAYLNRGNLWFLAQQLDKAVEDYNVAIKEGVLELHVAHLNRGMAYEQLGKLNAAKADYESALALVADWPQATQRLARVMKKLR